jgi:hypothetical protein
MLIGHPKMKQIHTPKVPRRRERGAAFAEAVMLLLFMIIIFAGVQYLARYFEAKQRSLLTARRCAWTFSRHACVDDAPLPAVCAGVVGPQRVRETPDEGLGATVAEHAQNDGPASNDAVAENDTQGHLKGGVNEAMNPLLEMVVGQSLTAVATNDIQRNPVTNLAPGSITASYYLPCNLAKKDPFDIVSDLWNGLVEF